MFRLGWQNSAQIGAYTYLALHCIHIKPFVQVGRTFKLWSRTSGCLLICLGWSL